MIISLRSEVLREIWIATWLDGKTQDSGIGFCIHIYPFAQDGRMDGHSERASMRWMLDFYQVY